MKLKHKSSCDCVECEWMRHRHDQKKQKERETARKVRKQLGIQYRREVLGRLIEEGMNSFYYSEKEGQFMSVNDNLSEWLKLQIENAHNAQERWLNKRNSQ